MQRNTFLVKIYCITDDPECRFEQNEVSSEFKDARGQIEQFCGQEPVCKLFNNPEALQLAKKNVEKYFGVVGIMENMNMTLSVAEKKMPQYFVPVSRGGIFKSQFTRTFCNNKTIPSLSKHGSPSGKLWDSLGEETYHFAVWRYQMLG